MSNLLLFFHLLSLPVFFGIALLSPPVAMGMTRNVRPLAVLLYLGSLLLLGVWLLDSYHLGLLADKDLVEGDVFSNSYWLLEAAMMSLGSVAWTYSVKSSATRKLVNIFLKI